MKLNLFKINVVFYEERFLPYNRNKLDVIEKMKNTVYETDDWDLLPEYKIKILFSLREQKKKILF